MWEGSVAKRANGILPACWSYEFPLLKICDKVQTGMTRFEDQQNSKNKKDEADGEAMDVKVLQLSWLKAYVSHLLTELSYQRSPKISQDLPRQSCTPVILASWFYPFFHNPSN